MSDSNYYIRNVAIVGAGGNLGKHFVEEILKTGKHTVTALTRAGSSLEVPADVKKIEVDYDNQESIVSALQGQDYLIITLAVGAPPDLQGRIIGAAKQAGVKHISPNVYGTDIYNEGIAKEGFPSIDFTAALKGLDASGLKYTTMVCGFWYEWSLSLGDAWFGFDIKNKKVTMVDEGTTKIITSTWRQCGRAMAAFLSLPISGSSPSISDWDNKPLYLESFLVSQRDMLDSLHRVLGDSDADWEITYRPSKERWEEGMKEMKEGGHLGFVKVMYNRNWFPNGGGDFSHKDPVNKTFGLPKEDLDEATKRAIDLVKGGFDASAQGKLQK